MAEYRKWQENGVAHWLEYPAKVYEQCDVPATQSLDLLLEKHKYNYLHYKTDYHKDKKFFVSPRDTYFNLYTRATCNTVTNDYLRGHSMLPDHFRFAKFYHRTRRLQSIHTVMETLDIDPAPSSYMLSDVIVPDAVVHPSGCP
jgi:hypothetical protein